MHFQPNSVTFSLSGHEIAVMYGEYCRQIVRVQWDILSLYEFQVDILGMPFNFLFQDSLYKVSCIKLSDFVWKYMISPIISA